MAKGQVTEKDLESGLRSLGGLGGLGGGGGARRDSPFGTDFVKKTAPAQAKPLHTQTGNTALKLQPEGDGAASPDPEPEAPAPLAVADPTPVVEETSKRRSPRRQKKPETKIDLFPERVTVLMSPDMRDRINSLAAKLQRKKSDKSERITANTIHRVALSVLLSNLKLEDSDAPNTEEELLELAQRKIRRG